MKRRSFLGALAAVFAAPKLLESIKTKTPNKAAFLEWADRQPDWTKKEPVTNCPNCGRFRTDASRAVIVKAPNAGVAAIADGDYMYIPSSPTYIDGCLRCAEDADEDRVGYVVTPLYRG